MRTFDYRNLPHALFEREVGDLSAKLFEDRGKLQLIKQLYPSELAVLSERAHIDNVDSSTRVEGIYIGRERTERLLSGAAAAGDTESQVVGYASALSLIEDDPDALDLSTGSIVRLYETLYSSRDLGKKSRYRRKDYAYVQMDGQLEAVPVSPVPAFETPLVLGGACDSLAGAFDAKRCSPLVLAAVFTIDFLCIRPFDEGNGRIARLFANLLLEKGGFDIWRYVSVDKLVEESGMAYYDALNACVEGWDRGGNDYAPYVRYWFEILHEAYARLFARTDLRIASGNKTERVQLFVEHAGVPVTKKQILSALPDVSVSTVENALAALVREGRVHKVGAGRSTAYVAGAGDERA